MSANSNGRATVADFLAHAPGSVLRQEVAHLQRVVDDVADDELRRRQEAQQQAEAAAAKEYADSLHARTTTWREDDPPSAEELNIDVTGLSEARSMLVRFAAWLTATKAELDRLVAALAGGEAGKVDKAKG